MAYIEQWYIAKRLAHKICIELLWKVITWATAEFARTMASQSFDNSMIPKPHGYDLACVENNTKHEQWQALECTHIRSGCGDTSV